MQPTVRHDPDRCRYELVIDEQIVGVADYRVVGDEAVFTHTEVSQHLRGQGLGELLVRGAMDDVRTTGRTVVPRCWFVLEFLDTHPEYADLRAA